MSAVYHYITPILRRHFVTGRSAGLVSTNNMESVEQNRSSRRKPHRTHKVVLDVSSASNQVAEADSDFGLTSGIKDSQLTGITQPIKRDSTPSKLSSEQFGLPEGTVVVQPEDATDSPFQGPEFFPAESSNSDVADVDASEPVECCTVCRHKLDVNKPESAFKHSILNVLLCKHCYKIHQLQVSEGKSPAKNFCSWCSAGLNLICCDVCPAMFCKACIRRNLGRDFLASILDSDDEEKWHCFICSPEPLLGLVNACAQFLARHLKPPTRGIVKRRKSAGKVLNVPQKQPKSDTVVSDTAAPPKKKRGRKKLTATTGQSNAPAGSNVTGAKSVVNGGSGKIHRPEYDKDMMPVNEHNVWPVLEKLLAATQSMSMLLGSLKDDLKRTSALAAAVPDNMAASDNRSFVDIALKRREAALKLWRAFDAYQKSFVDIETYSRETSKTTDSVESASMEQSAVNY